MIRMNFFLQFFIKNSESLSRSLLEKSDENSLEENHSQERGRPPFHPLLNSRKSLPNSRNSINRDTERETKIEIIYLTIKGHSGDTKKGKNSWKDEIHKEIETAIRSHKIFSKIQNLCVVVSELNGDAIRQLAAYLDISNTLKCKELIARVRTV